MLRLADVARRHGSAYMERYGASMLPSHVGALQSILRCRTPAMGGHVAVCSQCGVEHLLFHSCRNRACPQCGFEATCKWVQGQKELLLPVTYFHVVFTLPAELRRVVRSNQTLLIPALFRAAADSLAKLCRDARYVGAEVGALAVLHTWTRTLEFHPHIHMLVPGVGLDADGTTIRFPPRRKKRFLVPVRALAKLFRQRFLALARQALPMGAVAEIPWGKSWVVFAKAAVQGADRVLEYLGRYVHKTAIGDGAIVACDDATVTFRYRDNRTHQPKLMTLPAHEFLRRFLQHVLPKGMHRVRAFGLLHPAHRDTLRRIQLALAPRTRAGKPEATNSSQPKRRCPTCGEGDLHIVRRVSPAECLALVAAGTATVPSARAPPCPVETLHAPGATA